MIFSTKSLIIICHQAWYKTILHYAPFVVFVSLSLQHTYYMEQLDNSSLWPESQRLCSIPLLEEVPP